MVKRGGGNAALLSYSTILDFDIGRALRKFKYNKKKIFIIRSFCCLRSRAKLRGNKVNGTKVYASLYFLIKIVFSEFF